jgi:poly-beta-hydroxybutyrate-responsive repressor
VERFTEPALLLLLEEQPAHGYELIERLPELLGDDARIDMGNLYRVLRALEEEGLVASEWDVDAPGPAKRRYKLTRAGSNLLADWVTALEAAQTRIEAFIDRYARNERR